MPDDSSPQEYSTDEFVTVFRSRHHDAEIEAESIRGLLESAGLKSMIVRENVPELPTGWVQLKVLSSDAAEAKELIESACRSGGAAGGEEPND